MQGSSGARSLGRAISARAIAGACCLWLRTPVRQPPKSLDASFTSPGALPYRGPGTGPRLHCVELLALYDLNFIFLQYSYSFMEVVEAEYEHCIGAALLDEGVHVFHI